MTVKMKYNGEQRKVVKLPSGVTSADNSELFMIAEVSPGDVAEFEHERTLHFANIACCIDGSKAWVKAPSTASVTVTFKTIHPKAPSRRTSWKSRGGGVK